MSLGIEQILAQEKALMSDRGMLWGLGGAIAGEYIGRQLGMGFLGTAMFIAGGHFAGHSIAKATKA